MTQEAIRMLLVIFLLIPIVLICWNVISTFQFAAKKKELKYSKCIEVIAICIGFAYEMLYLVLSDVTARDWDAQLYNYEKHTMIASEYLPTVICFICVAFFGYLLLRFIPIDKQSPILSALGISSMYLGIIVAVIWTIQTFPDLIHAIVPINCILIFIKTIAITVYGKNNLVQTKRVSLKYEKLNNILNRATNLPWIAFILLIPLTGILVAIMFLFGQEPSSMIKAWTETAEWTFSIKQAPPNVYHDEHYLCTVAAGGHDKVVKPLRTGKRHGHIVIVNRQLCIANAFEQILEEKTPRFHGFVRKAYDSTGYPIAKHIKTKKAADIIYIIMKPLEWIFLLVIYLVDVHPEDRIAVQYPHKEIASKMILSGSISGDF